jgi:alpha-1,2-mannosyltransferase
MLKVQSNGGRAASGNSAAEVCIAPALLAAGIGSVVWNAALLKSAMRLNMNDFGKFYYSARAFIDGTDMYAPTVATEGARFLNMNPPHFQLLTLPLALLPLETAFMAWMAASVFALMLSIFLIVGDLGLKWRTPTQVAAVLVGILAFSGTQGFFATAQLSLLLLLVMTICWIDARHGRWLRAGAWLGACLSLKPFLLIFVPYLVATRRFRACAALFATATVCFIAGLLVFGVGPYIAWYRALAGASDWAWPGINASTLGFFQRTFRPSPFFTPTLSKPELVKFWVIIAAPIGLATLAAAILDRTRATIDRAFALLLVGAQLLSPLGWVYYSWLPAGPMAALLGHRDKPSSNRWKAVAGGVAVIGLFWPVGTQQLFQPHRWATVSVGSVYFWATAALWVWLLADSFDER